MEAENVTLKFDLDYRAAEKKIERIHRTIQKLKSELESLQHVTINIEVKEVIKPWWKLW